MEDWIYANTHEKNKLLIQRMDEKVEYAIRRLESHLEHNYPMNRVDQLAIEKIRKFVKNSSEYENRKQQRFVQEQVSALLLPLKPFLKPEISEAVDIALRIINNTEVKDKSE